MSPKTVFTSCFSPFRMSGPGGLFRKDFLRKLALLALSAFLLGGVAVHAQDLEPFDLLILADEPLCAPLQILKLHKDQTGIRTKVVSWQQVDADYAGRGVDVQERIKRYIADCEGQYGIQYVMLVGDADCFPVRYCSTDLVFEGADRCFIDTDLYYADLYDADGNFCSWDANGNGWFGEMDAAPTWDGVNIDQVDMLPDVALGRVPASTPEEVLSYIRKIIGYERESFEADWERRILLASAAITPSVSTCQHMELIDRLYLPEYESIKLYHEDNPCQATELLSASNIVNTLNEGVGFVAFAGHGGSTQWVLPGEDFRPADVARLDNANRLPIIFASACSTAKFAPAAPYDAYTDIHGDTHIGTHRGEVVGMPVQPAPLQEQNPDGISKDFLFAYENGAVAYIGSTGISQTSLSLLMEKFFSSYSQLADQGRLTVGNMAKIMIASYYQAQNFAVRPDEHPRHLLRKMVQPWSSHLLGDPSLRIGGVSGVASHMDDDVNFTYGEAMDAPLDRHFYQHMLTLFEDQPGSAKIYIEDDQNTAYLMDSSLHILAQWSLEPPDGGEARWGKSCMAADLTGDGLHELVTMRGMRGVDGDFLELLMVHNQAGELVWHRTYLDAEVGSPDYLSLGDVDGDGEKDVIFVSSDPPIVVAVDRQGEIIGEPVHIPTRYDMLNGPCAVGDFDGDQIDEVVVTDMGGCTFVLHFDTGKINELGIREIEDRSYTSESPPVLGDLNEDGQVEIIATTIDDDTLDAYVYIWNGAEFCPDCPIENALRMWKVPVRGHVSPPSLADLDFDGTPEIVVLSEAGVLFAWDAFGVSVYTGVADGLGGRYLGGLGPRQIDVYQPLLAGIDPRDGAEILYLNRSGLRPDISYKLQSFRADPLAANENLASWAQRMWLSDELPVGGSDSYYTRTAAMDLDGDAAVDVVIATVESVRILNGNSVRADIQWGLRDGDPQNTRNYEASTHPRRLIIEPLSIHIIWEEWSPLPLDWKLWHGPEGKLPEWWYKIMKDKPVSENATYFGNTLKGNYDAGKERVLLQRFSKKMEIPKEAHLRFRSWESTEANLKYDTRKVYMHHEKYGRILIHQCFRDEKAWVDVSVDLAKYAGQKISFEFEFDSVDGYANGYTGWFIDDVRVEGPPVSETKITVKK